jgi:tripartite-type tricarboxylate transporter receptor subunit TctC
MDHKKGNSICCVLLVTFLVINSGWFSLAQAQEKYPTKAIDIIVPFLPGGAQDLVTRIVANYLSKKWGVPINTVNKPGGNTIPACLEVMNASPDGYTLLGDGQPSSSTLKILERNLPFDIMNRSFISMLCNWPMMFMVHYDSPFKNMNDLAEDFKKSPESFTWASSGTSSPQEWGMRQFSKSVGVEFKRSRVILTKGGAEHLQLLLGGNIKLIIFTPIAASSPLENKLIRALGIASKSRYPLLPDVPTMAEQGYPKVTVGFWCGISGPPKLPAHIVEKWNSALKDMVNDPQVVDKLKSMKSVPRYMNPAELRQYVAEEIKDAEAAWDLK